MIETLTASWEALQTEETRSVVDALNRAGFERADAYRSAWKQYLRNSDFEDPSQSTL